MKKVQPNEGVLHTKSAMPRTWFNRLFAATYLLSIFALIFHHCHNIVSTTDHRTTRKATIILLIADLVLAFMWSTRQAFRMSPVRRQVFPENLTVDKSKYPALDVFVCTADPRREPPIGVVNTALSLMAYDYPTDKLSVYVSDDGGSKLTLFALMEAAEFAKQWLPYCKKHSILDRAPEAYFASQTNSGTVKHDHIKALYEKMKMRINNVVERGRIDGYVTDKEAHGAFAIWQSTPDFTPRNHPAVVQVVMESATEKDNGHQMPNLVYVSREKSKSTLHNYKAGALNVLLRVSATMTNAPIVLTQDCDMFSNDPKTPLRALCYFTDPKMDPNLALVQFPQTFHGINKDDIYSAEVRDVVLHNCYGMDGILGPIYMGSGAFFRRKIFFGSPGSHIPPLQPSEFSPNHVVNKSISSVEVMTMSRHFAGCNFEAQSKWGSEIGFRYGSLVEDYNTGYRIQCQGWKSIFCNPIRPAFLGSSPITLHDMLNQSKRWSMGLLNVTFSKYNPLLFGVRFINPFQAFCFGHYAFWPIWSIPLIVYSFLPQLALINSSHTIFPKVTDPWLFVYVFLFLGSYAQELIEYVTYGSTSKRWWNNQRVWMMRSLSSFPFSAIEYIQECCGLSSFGYNVTSKVLDREQKERNAKCIFEFGEPSPFFVPITMASIINLWALLHGMKQVVVGNESFEDVFVQMFLAGFGVLNCWPVYEAIVLRKDKGKMPLKITLVSTFLAWLVYLVSSLAF